MKMKIMSKIKINNGSFRDPSGYIFHVDGEVYRVIEESYKENYEQLISSQLYSYLVKNKWLIPHTEVPKDKFKVDEGYKLIKPEFIDFISYPYEWCFSQLKDAALLTLKIQKAAIQHKMSLKDATAFNVQFVNGKAIFIDSLSFEEYDETGVWIAYNQFCRHFLAPLTLMSNIDISLNKLFITNIDGVPLELANKMLPLRKKVKNGLFLHLYLHSKWQQRYEKNDGTGVGSIKNGGKLKIEALIDSLYSTIEKITLNKKLNTEWGDYYNNTNYTDESFNHKKYIVSDLIERVNPSKVWDLGANDGTFSRVIANKKIPTVSFDIDPIAVEKNYLKMKKDKEEFVLPLIQDLTNTSPGIGFANLERASIGDRANADMIIVLALIHHLAISNNLPFSKIAEFFATLGEWLIIEFVPKGDSKVEFLLSSREDIFDNYMQVEFEKAFLEYYNIIESVEITDTLRTIYLLKRK